MFRFVESIRLENGHLQHVKWHEKRLNETRSTFFPGLDFLHLDTVIDIPESLSHGLYKCRLVYDDTVCSIEFIPYIPKTINALKLVCLDEIKYDFKFEDRSCLNEALRLKGEADDVLIVKNGCITDTTFSNVALFDGTQWCTPDTYLLNGTCRKRLIQESLLVEKRIGPKDLSDYKYIRPINAMLDLEDTPNVEKII